MSTYNWREQLTTATPRVDAQELLRWVYMWMGFGLLVTTIVALVTVQNAPAIAAAAPGLFFGAIVVELILVIALSAAIMRLSPAAAGIMFFVYSALNGFTLSGILLIYTEASIVVAFGAAAALFGAMSILGFTTKLDLTQYRSYFMIGLVGLVIAMVINMFLGSAGLDWLISVVGVLLFTALAAYDTQRIVRMANSPEVQADGSIAMKLSILGALTLYLDFINLFLFLLRLLGTGRD